MVPMIVNVAKVSLVCLYWLIRSLLQLHQWMAGTTQTGRLISLVNFLQHSNQYNPTFEDVGEAAVVFRCCVYCLNSFRFAAGRSDFPYTSCTS